MEEYFKWIGASILIMLSLVSGYKILKQKTVTKNLLTLFIVTVISTLILFGIYPTALEYGGLKASFSKTNQVQVENPFGENELILNGENLILTSERFDLEASESKMIDKPLMIQIDKPKGETGFKLEKITATEYADKLSPNGGEFIEGFSLLRDAVVFRVYHESNVKIGTDEFSYDGKKVSEEEYKTAWQYYVDSDSAEPLNIANFVKELEDISDTTFLSNFRQNGTLYNEISIVIVDKKDYEKTLIASQGGRYIEPNPLNFLLTSGGTLPRLDVNSIKHSTVSNDGRIWGFYGEREFHNLIVNEKREENLFQDFYRIYVMNSDYIYQITLSYVPNSNTPRKVWDQLVKSLNSLRIIE